MKKLAITVLTILSCGAAYALPLGNPSEASLLLDGFFFEGCCYEFCQPGVSWCDAYSLRIGYYGDFVFNRHLEVDTNHNDDDIEDTELFTNAAYIALNFFDTFDIFATFGATNFWISTNGFSFTNSLVINSVPVDTSGTRFVLETDTDFSWSLGARATLWKCGCTQFGVEGQYFYTHPHILRTTVRDFISIYPDHFVHMKYQEWQLGAGISHRIWNLVPYIGIKISGVKVDFGDAMYGFMMNSGTPDQNSVNFVLEDLENHTTFGYALGVSLIDCERMALTVEARYPDEKALYVNGQIRF